MTRAIILGIAVGLVLYPLLVLVIRSDTPYSDVLPNVFLGGFMGGFAGALLWAKNPKSRW